MQKGEGVTKFNLVFEKGPNEFSRLDIMNLMSCREDLYRLGLIGTSGKYCDKDDSACITVGYGNVSQLVRRIADGRHIFAVSGTRTGNKSQLTEYDYTTVLEYDPRRNYVKARGHIEPSSESMTHGAIYDIISSSGSVVHVHDHDSRLWKVRHEMGIPMTALGVNMELLRWLKK
ncbi:MAG: class II aldolase/adducin family protein [Candidatus Aenigmarchaeota archaeon]|nr:class II aldolase/adducin family protein [Candidatus Aenigmarchaeota archaeon]